MRMGFTLPGMKARPAVEDRFARHGGIGRVLCGGGAGVIGQDAQSASNGIVTEVERAVAAPRQHAMFLAGRDHDDIAKRALVAVEGKAISLIDRLILRAAIARRSEEHTSELQSLMRLSYAVFCLQNKKDTI